MWAASVFTLLLLRNAEALSFATSLGCDGTDLCCSLSGSYDAAAGTCACRAPWSGANCSTLDLLPAQPFPQGYGVNPNTTAWGGSALLGADGLYHLLVAEMAGGCPLSTWETNSFVAHAVAATPDGPYTREGPAALGVWAHNPAVVAYEGGFALFHIGLGEGGMPVNCSSGGAAVETGGGGNGLGAATGGNGLGAAGGSASGSTLHLATSLSGPWTPVLRGYPPNCNNPAPALHPTNGTWFLICDSTLLYRLDGTAPFAAPVGNWTQVTALAPTPNRVPGNYEDAFLFFDTQTPEPGWHVLFHIWTTVTNITTCTNSTVSGLAFSRDGLQWLFSESEPYGNVVEFSDGTSLVVPTRERPKIHFDPVTRAPTHLFNGATGGCTSCLPHWCSHCKQECWDLLLVQPIRAS